MKGRGKSDSSRRFQRYLNKISSFPKLGAKQERELFEKWHDNRDESAKKTILTSHLRSVAAIAKSYRSFPVNLEDLVSEGNVGLVVAFNKYETQKGTRFITYASYWIRAFMLKLINRALRKFRTGSGPFKSEILFKLKRERAKILCSEGDREKAYIDLSRKMNMPVDKVKEMMSAIEAITISLDAPVKGAENITNLDQLLDFHPTPEEETSDHEVKDLTGDIVQRALQVLSSREQYIIQRRILDSEQASLAEIGSHLGISRERARQLEEKAKRKLRSFLNKSGIKDTGMFS